MSLTRPHIRAMRAEADALDVEAAHLKLSAPSDNELLCRALTSMATAKRVAADVLMKEEAAMLEKAMGTAI
jgi:hypothetical protein